MDADFRGELGEESNDAERVRVGWLTMDEARAITGLAPTVGMRRDEGTP